MPTVVLLASERVLEELPSISAITWSTKDNSLYGVSASNPGLYAYEPESKTAKQVGASNLNGRSVTAAPSGDVYVSAGESGVVALSQAKPGVKRVANHSWRSLGLLTDDSVVVSPSDDNSLFSIFKSAGGPGKRIGQKKEFVLKGTPQNEFFNQGIVAVNEIDNTIYYVFTHALAPTVQHFNKDGELLAEFQVEGAAIDLQAGPTRDILRAKPEENCARGFTVITSATVDPTTGHLWLGMNGSTKHGTVYEYSREGVKLKEYGFLLKQPSNWSDIITGINGIVVRAPYIYVLTSEGAVYKFNLEHDVSAKLRALRDEVKDEQVKTFAVTKMVKYVNSFWTPAPSALSLLQLPCPGEQPLTCTVNCNSNTSPATRNCGQDVLSGLPDGDRVIGQTGCNNTGTGAFGQPTCVVSYNACRTTHFGDRYSTNYTATCNPPTCTSPKVNNPTTGACQCPAHDPCPTGQTYNNTSCSCVENTGGGFCGFGFCPGCDQPQDACGGCPSGFIPNIGTCCCDPIGSPILVDISGNGFRLTDGAGGVEFDLNSNGVAEHISWTVAGSDDAWLALDRNGNGAIDDGSELFGNFTSQPDPPAGQERNGFLALAEYDKPNNGGNGDGLITPADSIFSSLRLWQDSNHNGISEAAELIGLQAVGLKTFELDYKEAKKRDEYGNQFRYRAKVRGEQGTQISRWAWDVFLVGAK